MVAAVEGVGQNFQDHPDVYLPWSVRRGTGVSGTLVSNPLVYMNYITNYIVDQTGTLVASDDVEQSCSNVITLVYL